MSELEPQVIVYYYQDRPPLHPPRWWDREMVVPVPAASESVCHRGFGVVLQEWVFDWPWETCVVCCLHPHSLLSHHHPCCHSYWDVDCSVANIHLA